MIVTNVTQLVRAQLIQHLDTADEAIKGIRSGMQQVQLGNRRGSVDTMLSTTRLSASLRQAATAEVMLRAAGDVGTKQHGVVDALQAARTLMHRGDGDARSLESLARSARIAMDRDPGALASLRAASDDRLDTIARQLDDIDSTVSSRLETADRGSHGWISSDGEFHDF